MLLDKIKLILGDAATGKDALLSLLMEDAQAFAVSYCRLNAYKDELDNIIIRMVLEDFNRIGGEGLTSQGFNSLSETYENDYSQQVYKQLNSFRKLKFI